MRMFYLNVKIEKYISYEQPGWVLCVFKDVSGKEWHINEKVPIITERDFIKEEMPIEGFYIAGEILSEEADKVLFSIKEPWGIETIEGETEFEVYRNQISTKHSDEI